jgi:regulator of protease activity HflC (stomatin/prohibitin superfamily)
VWLVVMALVGLTLMQAPRVARQWERAVVLRLGDSSDCAGPACSGSFPSSTACPSRIDQRTITTSFAAEQTLTSDTVPVNVDAVLFWMVHDVEKAALEVQDYAQAVSWAAQTALRDIIGRTTLTDLLRGRERIESELQQLIDQRSNPWGVTVSSVEMRDVVIPGAAGRDVARGAGRARRSRRASSSARRSGDRALVRGSREDVPEQSDRAPPARDEHALRRAERKGRDDDRAEQRRRVDGDGRPAGRRRAAAAVADPRARPAREKRRREMGLREHAGLQWCCSRPRRRSADPTRFRRSRRTDQARLLDAFRTHEIRRDLGSARKRAAAEHFCSRSSTMRASPLPSTTSSSKP